MAFDDALNELESRKRKALATGGGKKLAERKACGMLNARERIARLFDPGTFVESGMRLVHPGEILRVDYLTPLKLSANALAKALNVPTPRMNDIVRERRGVSADTAMRLARYLGGDARSWLNL